MPADPEAGDSPPSLGEVGEDPDARFTFANERTFLAWNRTALALVAAGAAAAAFLRTGWSGARLVVALPLIALMVSDVILNVFQYHQPLLTWEILPRYVALGLISALGFALRGRATPLRLFGASFAGQLLCILDPATAHRAI